MVVIWFASFLDICCKTAEFCSKLLNTQLSTHLSAIQHYKIPLNTNFHTVFQICSLYLTGTFTNSNIQARNNLNNNKKKKSL